jgi:hypothetical protein
MGRSIRLLPACALLALTACDRSPPAAPAASAPITPPPAVASSVDAEFEQLKSMAPVDACATLTPEKLKQVFPNLTFEVHQKLEPQMSGYVWDSRCTYWAGVGSMEFAKDTPTHAVEIFIATSVSEAKAKANLASRRESAASGSGFQPQDVLGAEAYATTGTGVASLFFVKGPSQVQINLSDLNTPNDEKLRKAVALAQLL